MDGNQQDKGIQQPDDEMDNNHDGYKLSISSFMAHGFSEKFYEHWWLDYRPPS
jgi:hypothetical protein